MLSGDLDELVAKIKQAHDGDITLHGSTQLVQALLDRDLVDEDRGGGVAGVLWVPEGRS